MDKLIERLRHSYNELISIHNGQGLTAAEPVTSEQLAEVERRLSLVLPDDLKSIATEFGDVFFTLKPQYAFGSLDDPDNVAQVTLERRREENLPSTFVCLSEQDEDLILLESQAHQDLPTRVFWLDISAYRPLSTGEFPSYVYETFPSYGDYFTSLLERDLENQKERHQ